MSSYGSFEDFCKSNGIRHYGDDKTYSGIESMWKRLCEIMQGKQGSFTNSEQLISYIITEHDIADSNKYIYWYIINEFDKYRANAELYSENFKDYNKRLVGYSRSRGCKNMNDLKKSLSDSIKKMKTDGANTKLERRRDFLIMARYICDYLEDFPEDIPRGLFRSNGTSDLGN